ncbi:MAG: thiamine phosphate synthase [Lactobacillus sp.]|uniref:thiamine phosphate synthase n=1 Tax=Bombilactobacillus bombi TaxID=1303590 RepID=UPI0035E7183E|nr:thiamine phosphate synthase [Lactobacillus sp.]
MKKFNPQMLNAYFICGSQDLKQDNILTVVQKALAAGITAFQFRDKGPNSHFTPDQRLQAARQLKALCNDYHVPFLIDDDVQLALKVQADGIHVGQSDQKITQVIQSVGQKMIIGYSCSNLAEVQAANQIDGIDYYGCGPIFATTSKADASPVIGISGLTRLVKAATRPVVAIGGIKTDDLSALAQTQAAGAAVISLLTQSSDYQNTVSQLRTAAWQEN